MHTIAEALDAMLPAFGTLGTEEVLVTEAHGRYLAEDVAAAVDSPPFDNSAMDGYAVFAGDVAEARRDRPVRLPIRGESRAGGKDPTPLARGSAHRVFTGARMPPGADAVIIQEDTERKGDEIAVFESTTPRRHVRGQGSDVRCGETIVHRGDPLWPGEIGILASQNISRVVVYRRPKVALLSTGDELEPLGAELRPGQIVNSNVYVLTEMLRMVGAVPEPLPAASDDVSSIEVALRDALRFDVVLTMGGVSVGAYDFVQDAFRRVGIAPDFWKVRIKPGKPLTFGVHQGKPLVGLPGNPISAMVTFEVLVAPCLRRMLGDPKPHPQPVPALLTHPYRRRPGRVEISRGRVQRSGEQLEVTLHDRQGSGSLSSFVGVNALVILPSDQGELEAGDRVDVMPWGAGLRSTRSFFEGVR